MSEHADWQDRHQPTSSGTHVGEALFGVIAAIALQAGLTALFIAGGAFTGKGTQPDTMAGWISCVSCGQFVWLFPAFVASLWWRPSFSGGLALGAWLGALLGFAISCLAVI